MGMKTGDEVASEVESHSQLLSAQHFPPGRRLTWPPSQAPIWCGLDRFPTRIPSSDSDGGPIHRSIKFGWDQRACSRATGDGRRAMDPVRVGLKLSRATQGMGWDGMGGGRRALVKAD